MNKKNILTHAIWLAVAGAAFAIGHYVIPPSGSGSQAGTKDSSRSATPVGRAPTGAGAMTAAGEKGDAAGMGDFAASGAGSGVLSLLSKSQMEEAVLAALSEPDLLKRNQMFAELLARLTPENVQAAIDTIRQNATDRDTFGQLRVLTYAWGTMDPEAALEYTDEIGGRGASFTTMSVLSGWATEDPQSALDWLAGQDGLEDWEQNGYERSILSGFAQSDPDAAMDYILAMEDTGSQAQYAGMIAREQIQTKGLDGALKWVATLADGDVKVSAYNSIAESYARKDLDAAAAWAVSVSGDANASRAIGEIADELAERSPNEAVIWAQNLPAGEAQAEAIKQVFSEWARGDEVDGAATYLNSMADSPAKDQAVASFAANVARTDGEGAVTWASTIQDAELREKATVQAAQNWYRTRDEEERAAAEAWIQTNLTPEAQEQATTRPDPRNGGFDFGGFGGGGRGPGGGGGPGGGRGPGGGGR